MSLCVALHVSWVPFCLFTSSCLATEHSLVGYGVAAFLFRSAVSNGLIVCSNEKRSYKLGKRALRGTHWYHFCVNYKKVTILDSFLQLNRSNFFLVKGSHMTSFNFFWRFFYFQNILGESWIWTDNKRLTLSLWAADCPQIGEGLNKSTYSTHVDIVGHARVSG